MTKIDFKKELKHLYQAAAKAPALVEVPRLQYLMIDGVGDPNVVPEFSQAAEALFRVSYALKFMVKKEEGRDYAVMPLEGLWYVDDLALFRLDRKDLWKWTLMILQPEFVTMDRVQAAIGQAAKKKDLPGSSPIRFTVYEEGLAAQILHIGPYAEEGPLIAGLHDFISGRGYKPRGKHHEIYLSNPRRTAPEKLKTIIRQPVF